MERMRTALAVLRTARPWKKTWHEGTFTVNAMAMDLAGNLTDPYSGQRDLEHHVLRVVGSPSDRFSEDALRMFRACRFVAQLGFLPEAGILPAIKAEAPRAKGLSLSRVKAELHKLLRAPYAGQGMNLMVQSGLAGMSCRIKKREPMKASPFCRSFSILWVSLKILASIPLMYGAISGMPWTTVTVPLTLGWAILLHDVGKGRKVSGAFAPMACPVTMDTTRWEKPWRKAFSTVWGKRSPSEPCGFSCRKPYAFWTCSIPAGCGTLALASEGSPQRAFRCTKDLQEAFRNWGPFALPIWQPQRLRQKVRRWRAILQISFSDGRYYARPYSRPCHKRAGPYCCGNSAKGP